MTTAQLNETDVLDFLEVGVNTSESTHPDDPISKARIRVTLDQLRPYDRNPRQSQNPKFDSIMASIEARGLDHPPNISRRNPDDKHYLIIDGGNTRLEILNILYKKYKDLAGKAETNEEKMLLLEKAQSFYTIDCTFKPWKSESSTLAGHMSENEERGDTLFIEKALAVQEFRRIYEEEDRLEARAQGKDFKDKPITIRALATRISDQGWTVSNSHISRFEYAANHLLPVVPNALWAGSGFPLIINIRRLEKAYSTFWATTDHGRNNPQHLLDLFFETLAEFDDESIDLDGFARALDRKLGESLNLPAQTVCAEIGAVMAGVAPTAATETEGNVDSDSGGTPESSKTRGKNKKSPEKNKSATSGEGATDNQNTTPVPMTPKARQEAIINVAVQLAARYELVLDRVDREKTLKGCDWFFIHPLSTKDALPGNPDDRAAVWWALFKLSRTYRQVSNSHVHKIFMDTFKEYLSDDMLTTNVVLLLNEFECALPEDDREHLRKIETLIRQGSVTDANKTDQGDQGNGRT